MAASESQKRGVHVHVRVRVFWRVTKEKGGEPDVIDKDQRRKMIPKGWKQTQNKERKKKQDQKPRKGQKGL